VVDRGIFKRGLLFSRGFHCLFFGIQ
jgi:hypothetical protein